jgi:hypothetical protein
MINFGKYNVVRLFHFFCGAVVTVVKESEIDRVPVADPSVTQEEEL